MAVKESLIPVDRIEQAIFLVRGQKVMLDADLAQIYGVSTARLNQQVKRNLDRFPEDFMFRAHLTSALISRRAPAPALNKSGYH